MAAPGLDPDPRSHRGAIPALLAGIVAIVTVAIECASVATLRTLPIGPIVCAVAAFATACFHERKQPRPTDRPHPLASARIGFWLAALALGVSSVVEQPIWPSIDTFGTSIAIPYIAVLGFVGVLAFDCVLGHQRRLESALGALTIFAAFGGPLFLRDGASFHALYGLLCVAAYGYALPNFEFSRTPRSNLLLYAVGVLIGISILPFGSGVDRGHHLSGWCRMLMAFAPIPLIASASNRFFAARTTLFAFVFALLLGVASSASALVEPAQYVDLAHVLRARLSLFGEHPNIIAPYFAIGIPLAIAAALQTRRRSISLLMIVIAGGAFYALQLTQSRAALAGGVIGILVLLALGLTAPLTRRLDTKTKWIAAIAVLLIGVVGAGFALRHRIAAKLNDPSMEFRVYMWTTAASALEDRPLSGYGFLSAEPLMNHAEPSDLDGRTKDTHPHMMLLSVALGAGMPAAILFACILLAIGARAATSALRSNSVPKRMFAAAIAASLVALFLSNLLDQGLALNTPIPLHVGTLIALLIGIQNSTVEQDRARSRTNTLLCAATILVCVHSVQSRVENNLLGISRTAAQRKDTARAAQLAAIAHRLDPWDRDSALRHAAALDRIGKRQDAADVLAEATERFSNSPYPWEALANLEYDRRNWTSALTALTRARQRDPTGPSSSQWSLRIANIQANLGRRQDSMNEFARAIRFDYEAAARAGWIQDENKEYFVPVFGSDSPIFLSSILQMNRELLPNAVRDQPIQARRIATTLVKIALGFRKFSFAREVIAEYKSLTTEPWLPLEHLANELARLEKQDPSPAPTPGSEPDPAVAETQAASSTGSVDSDNDRFASTVGQSIVFMDQGRSLAAKNDHRGALEAYRQGLLVSYDIVAERQYIATLQDEIFNSALALKDIDLARQELPANLYFHVQPADRISIQLRLARAELDAGDDEAATPRLAECGELMTMLAPSRGDVLASELGGLLASMLRDKDPNRKARADALLHAFESTGPGLLTAMYAYRSAEQGSRAEAASKRLRLEFPEWLTAGHGRKSRR